MQWCLLLIWAQGLRQAPLLVSGAEAGKLVTSGNISAEEGGSATLKCHLLSTMAKVIQVNWMQRDQMLAIHHLDLGWHISQNFRERVVPGPDHSLLLQLLTVNDTGPYSCTYYTFPDGIYKGTLFLEVLGHSVAKHSTSFQMPWLGAVVTAVVICIAVIGVVTLARKKGSLHSHPAESGLRRAPSEQDYGSPRFLSAPGNCVRTEAAPGNLYREPTEVTYAELHAEPHDYFNVLSYRSLGSLGFVVETG
ncbi:PREDICTED: T-cell immunoreceptor with Ig and ITIM domains [Elephantulus edwardii]|uniref:T-cell immunoreceptor with Ig and ITIM domains n=1 Tax=Elephantulus edwardii TaxID=28737 RepID=UPI0003F0EAE7|nr:PREDICTED: T-cell immunoreceptor with Ig and ITIM domains [Elephantulus edwardii]